MTGPQCTEGRRRGLEATSSSDHLFAILALDHVASMAATMIPDDPGSVTDAQLVEAKVVLTRQLGEVASAVLLDPMVGYSPTHTPTDLARGLGLGLVLGIEAGDYVSPREPPRLLEEWSVERAADAGADAVKISFYFDPSADADLAERFVADVVAGCRRCDLPLFAEPLGVFRDGNRREVIVEAARRFGALGVDVLKLEYPVDVKVVADESVWLDACLELDAASPVPWTVLSAGEPFERFEAMIGVASAAGASGFVAGRALWREAVAGGTVETARAHEAARRLERLVARLDDGARPWSSHPSWTTSCQGGGAA